MKFYLGGAILLALPLFLTSCEGTLDDVFGEWSRPTGNNSNTDSDKDKEKEHSNQYLVYSYSTALDSVWTDIPSNATVWTSDLTEFELAAGTYVVAGADIKCAGQLVLKGDVNIILKDKCKLTVKDGITYDTTGSLKVYGQGISSSMGQLIVNNDTPTGPVDYTETNSIIAQTIEIHGGLVDARTETGAASDLGGHGILASSNLKIFNGKIIALGTKREGIVTDPCDMFIYGGDIDAKSTSTTGSPCINCQGNLTISGGIVNAAPASAAATGVTGIYLPSTKTLTISGGKVTATGSVNMEGIYADIINITGGTVSAYNGAGGSGAIKAETSIKIEGSETQVTATGANDDGTNRSSAGIETLSLTINGGTVTVTGGNGGAFFDNGAPAVWCIDGSNPGPLKVTGGTLIATGGNGSDGDATNNNGGKGWMGISAAPIDFAGGTVIATGGKGGNGYTTIGSEGDGGTGGAGIDCKGDIEVNASASVTAIGGNGGNVLTGSSRTPGDGGAALIKTGTLTGTLTETNGTIGSKSL